MNIEELKIFNQNLTDEDKTLYIKDNLRIHLISKVVNITDENLTIVTMPVEYGVGIEWCYNGKHYIVISFVQPDETGKTHVKPVGNRVKDYRRRSDANKELYEKIKNKARRIVREALKKNEN